MGRCAAPWLELNVSAPDNRVTACCYYGGQTDNWNDGTLASYWNSEHMRGLRRLQFSVAPPKGHGCESCHLFTNRPGGTDEVYNIAKMPVGLSARQEANWRLAHEEFKSGAEVLNSLPARVYGNFGFACNISCTMCHQVPRRLDNRRSISADVLLGWDLEASQEVHVIGGEPFVLPEAIKFIRAFVKNDLYESVRLVLATNGTLLHKHWQTLYSKQRLSVTVSLDGIGKPFEAVRIGADWPTIERNIIKLLEAQRTDRPEWRIKTASLIQKSTIANLPDFARWHAKHRLATQFSDFISAPGVEDTFHRENFLHNPQLLTQGWRDHFDEAIEIFDAAGMTTEVRDLSYFKERVEGAIVASAERIDVGRKRRLRNDWQRIEVGPMEVSSGFVGERHGMKAFLRTRIGDFMATPYIGVDGSRFRVRLHWPNYDDAPSEISRKAHVFVQDQDGREIEVYRDTVEYGVGTDHVLTGELFNVQAFRVVLTPVGEEVSLAPSLLEVEVDHAGIIKSWSPRAEFAQSKGLIHRIREFVGL
jgi:uncharacterized Fe-S cluster-containing radical SAM superfamily protein